VDLPESDHKRRWDEMSIPERMRANLKPRGTLPVVRLFLNDSFFDVGFVEKCIAEIEQIPLRAELGEEPSNLERLAYTLLCDSAYIKSKQKPVKA